MLIDKRIGFIGAGSMAEAILAGLLEKGEIQKKNLSIINRQDQNRLSELVSKYQLDFNQCKAEKVITADVIILAVKPNDLFDLLKEWGSKFHAEQCLVSVAAGISLKCIETFLQEKVSVIRSMPNTSSSVGFSATALSGGRWAREQDMEIAKQIFSSIGLVLTIKEELMDAVTGLSGSGPAYFYYMVEAMEQAGVKAGLSEKEAKMLTLQTILGAAHMLNDTKQEAKKLREAVTSPNGTTMAGLNTLREYRFEEAIEQAVLKAKERSAKMGKDFASRFIQV